MQLSHKMAKIKELKLFILLLGLLCYVSCEEEETEHVLDRYKRRTLDTVVSVIRKYYTEGK